MPQRPRSFRISTTKFSRHTNALRNHAIITTDDLLAPVHESWRACLADDEDVLAEIAGFLNLERAEGRGFLPAEHLVMRALSVPAPNVRVLVLGQDPYPTPGHAVGLAFSVARDVSPVPASLRNIFTELSEDMATPQPESGDLTPWTDQGVLLLNRVLTVTPGAAGSHRGRGWETITLAVVRELVRVSPGFVAVLWGKPAAEVSAELGDAPLLRSPHPSPLSAYRGFFGSRPFSWVNRELVRLGRDPIDWSLPGERSAHL